MRKSIKRTCAYILRRIEIVVVLLLLQTAVNAQVIKGRVVDLRTDSAVAGASIFFDGMFKGTSSDSQGNFTLNIAGMSKVPIIISSVGYNSETITDYAAGKTLNIYLERKVTQLNEVVISFDDGMSRKAKMAIFKREFLGSSSNGRSCEILNEDDIQLTYIARTNTVKAFCDKPIIIRNKNLGYKISYFLKNFSFSDKSTTGGVVSVGRVTHTSAVVNIEFFYEGNYYFEEEIPARTSDYEKVKQRRENAFRSSRMYFVRSLWNNSVVKDGFDLYTLPYKEFKSDGLVILRDTLKYIKPANKEVIYIHSKVNGESAMELVRDSVYIDKNGFYGAGIIWGGEMLAQRIGDLLPYEYGTELPAPVSAPISTDAAVAADPLITRILSLSDTLLSRYPQEKVHLHLDKPYYSIGDTIWLKAYVVDAAKNELSELSRVVYVELINERDSIKGSLRLPLNTSMAAGDIILRDTLREGNYRIRAYTSWMRNFGEEYFFNKALPIGNSLSYNIVAKASYTISKTESTENISAEISYTDLSGKPVAGKEVSYEIGGAQRKPVKGKSVTDASGNIHFTFNARTPTSPGSNGSQAAEIRTWIKTDPKESILKELFYWGDAKDFSLQFFPEGGNLVEGITSRVAFKALTAEGRGTEISGYISDKDNKKVTEFKSEHAGMGSFVFTPEANNTYKAVIRVNEQLEKTASLPKATIAGYALSAELQEENILVKVRISPGLQNGELTLTGQTNAVVHYVARKKAEGNMLTALIPKSRFPEGILQLTLFDPEHQPVAERLVFIQNDNNHLKVNLSTDKPIYQKREKVSMDLTVTDTEGNPVQGSFSLAVTDEGKVPYAEERETTIFSNLLLSSDLQGYIEQPNYYFTNVDTNKLRQLDNLLLTQGWRRFVWKDIFAGKANTLAYKAEKGIGISGRLLNLNNNAIAGRKVSALITGANTFILDTITNAEGRFQFNDLALSNTDKFTIRASNLKVNIDEPVKIEIDQVSAEKISLKYPSESYNDNSFLTYLQSSSERFNGMKQSGMLEGITLKEVRITTAKKTLQEEVRELAVRNSANPNGPGNADQVITFMDLQDCANFETCLPGILIGVKLSGKFRLDTKIELYSKWSSGPDQGTGSPMLIVINGVPTGTDLSVVAPENIEGMEILKSGARMSMYGLRGSNGVVIVTTKRGGIDYIGYVNEIQNPGYLAARQVKSYPAQGFYKDREFYSPDYADPKINTAVPDLRTTIYWNPSIITDANGKAKVEFYNADGTVNYRVITEGLTEDGKLGRQVFRYSVK